VTTSEQKRRMGRPRSTSWTRSIAVGEKRSAERGGGLEDVSDADDDVHRKKGILDESGRGE
jgi:hypothetical protein